MGHILHPNGSHLLSQWVPSVPSYSAVVPHGTHLRPPQVPPYILKGHTLKPRRSVARHAELGCVKARVKTCRAEPGWTGLNRAGPGWTGLDRAELGWTGLNRAEPGWTGLDQAGPGWTGLNRAELG